MAGSKVAFASLKALGEEKVGRIDDMLKKGMPASQIAAIIHNEWGDLKQLRPDSVKKTLERYRGTELRDRVVADIAGASQGMRTSTLQKRASAMDSLQELVDIQTTRFKKMLVKEQTMPLLLKNVSDEGRLLKEMLVELGRLQLETGVLHRAPKKITGQLTDNDGKVSMFEWTQEQEDLFKSIGADAGYVHVQEA